MGFNRPIVLGLVITAAMVLSSATSQAFDGKRKGFVVGLGGGIAPLIHWKNDNSTGAASEQGYGFNGLVAYAWDDRNVIGYEGIGWMYEISGTDSHFIIKALDGVRWYHYWGKRERRVFTSVGIGWAIGATESSDINVSGLGYTLGIGYEFLKQLQVGVYYIGAHTSNGTYTSNEFDVGANHRVLNLLITLVAY